MFSNPEANVNQLEIMPGMQVADLGAGIGFYSIPLAKVLGAKGRVYAIDVQNDLLMRLKNEAAQAHLTGIEAIHGNLEVLGGTKLRDGLIDYAVAANILFQITPAHRESFIKEVHRILRPGGRIAVIDWMESFGGIGPHPQDVVTSFQAQQLFTAHGFEFDHTISAGEHHYGLIFKRK